ncbi:Uncharacterised protein [Mycobacteroides abscessus subsp. abscessus]|nr:Uncharacterised protein [Mycobacteroides abscessus subsp. abscessus]
MHDRLRVHHHTDLPVGNAEEQMRLDEFETLIDQ